MTALAIAGVQLRRLFRYKFNIFWVVIAPLLFVFMLGVMLNGGHTPKLGLVVVGDGPMTRQLTAALRTDGRFSVENRDDAERLRSDVEHGVLHAGLVIPAGLDDQLRSGSPAQVGFVSRPNDPFASDLAVWAQSVVNQQSALARAARVATAEGAATFPQNLDRAMTTDVAGVTVATSTVGKATFPTGLNPFALMAPSMLLMYIFLTSLTAALRMIEARRLGITRRMYATPTPVRTIVAGEALGRFAIALTQGVIVMVGSSVLFGVDWGSPLGAIALLILFSMVGSGVAMLIGATLRGENQALAVSLALGLGLAALGGTMVPLEVLSPTRQLIARFTPHAWAYEGFAEIVRRGGGFVDILPQLGALAGFAVVLFTLGAWQLRRSIVR
ncbi:ABC transporter permease [Longispora sp. K20-0274]|uniref:ABC transporter permease n=1 Tax=Longispora sp. K20-0274 TaxID=3088255 RepID=UPI00399B81CB